MTTVNELHAKLLEGLPEKEREGFKAGLRVLGYDDNPTRVALREAFKREHPEWTEVQLDTAVRGKAFKQEHPEWTEAQLDAAVRGY